MTFECKVGGKAMQTDGTGRCGQELEKPWADPFEAALPSAAAYCSLRRSGMPSRLSDQ